MALSCATLTTVLWSLGSVPRRSGSLAQVGNDTSSFRDTELSSCQKSSGDPASKRGRHQGKMQRDLFLLLLPVRFLPSITGLQQTGGWRPKGQALPAVHRGAEKSPLENTEITDTASAAEEHKPQGAAAACSCCALLALTQSTGAARRHITAPQVGGGAESVPQPCCSAGKGLQQDKAQGCELEAVWGGAGRVLGSALMEVCRQVQPIRCTEPRPPAPGAGIQPLWAAQMQDAFRSGLRECRHMPEVEEAVDNAETSSTSSIVDAPMDSVTSTPPAAVEAKRDLLRTLPQRFHMPAPKVLCRPSAQRWVKPCCTRSCGESLERTLTIHYSR
ncbi:TP53-target gene 5 protein isoform X1 [Tympanuchus pallidicinctus]|uniref:TP53-target gene 5 protein isoform X1 n=1 Tax=Tympanuchus pallidicinctus TaxID=109042 RepID=UPI0022875F6D|nr:TP53-target gene 5 protein isoform X1 [Tympanuchus pallidicinctus]